MKPVLETRPTGRFTNADFLRGVGLSSSTREADGAEEEGDNALPVSSVLSFPVYQDDNAAGDTGGGGGVAGGDKESVFSNGLSFSVYQDDAGEGTAAESEKEGEGGGRGGRDEESVFSNGLSFPVYQDDSPAAAGGDKGEGGGDGASVFSNGLSFTVYRDDADDAAAGAVGKGAGGEKARGAEKGFSNVLSVSVYQDHVDDPAGEANGEGGMSAHEDDGATAAAPSASSKASLGPGFAVYTGKGSGGSGRGRGGVGDGGGGNGSNHGVPAALGAGQPDVKPRHEDTAVSAAGGSGVRKLEVSFFEDTVFGDAEGDDRSEETAGAASCLRFFDDSMVRTIIKFNGPFRTGDESENRVPVCTELQGSWDIY